MSEAPHTASPPSRRHPPKAPRTIFSLPHGEPLQGSTLARAGTGGSLVPRSRPGYSWRTPPGFRFGFHCAWSTAKSSITATDLSVSFQRMPERGASPPTAPPTPTGNQERGTGNTHPPLRLTKQGTRNQERGTSLSLLHFSHLPAHRSAAPNRERGIRNNEPHLPPFSRARTPSITA